MNNHTVFITENLSNKKLSGRYVVPKYWHRKMPRIAMAKLLSATKKHRYYLALLVFVAVILSPQMSYTGSDNYAAATAAPSQINRTLSETYYLSVINSLRQKNNLPPLIIDSRLSNSAMAKANDMVNYRYWGHYSSSGISFADFIWRTSPSADKVGENLAKCFENRQTAYTALVASPTHYQVMNGSFTNMGVAEAINPSDGCTYTVFHFAEYM